MRITQRELDRYRAQLAARQSDARAYLLARLGAEAEGLPVAEARERTIEIMRDCLGVYGDQAQVLSAELFGEVCRAEGIDADAEMLDGLIDDDIMQEKVRYYARALDGDEPDWRGYEGSTADLAAYYVHRSALGNVIGNCDRSGVRYARVPTGRETCGFCFMLASRGFVYKSEESAAAGSHLHCDCVVVPGVDGETTIEGYDPDELRDRWHECMYALGGDGGLRMRFSELSEEDLAKVRGSTTGEKWERWRNQQVYREVERRDNDWVWRGKAPEPDYSANPRSAYGTLASKSPSFNPEDYRSENITNRGNEWRDLFAHDALANAGYRIQCRGHEDIDLVMGGRPWEVKSPADGASQRYVESNLRSAKRQFLKRGLSDASVVFNSLYRHEDDDWVRREIARRMRQHGIAVVIHVGRDGSVTRLEQ